ncbi:hypothetical protein LPJ81_004674, partial [Coemansia sp. IMI 209127]
MKKRRSSGRKSVDYDQCKVAATSRGRIKHHGPKHILECLPDILFNSIFHYASGLAEVDNYLRCHLQHRHGRSFSLPLLFAMIRRCCPTMAQTKRSWRHLLLPELYRTAAYDGKTNTLLVPDEHTHHVRRIVILIPENYKSFRSMARTMYHLPEDVRAKVSWFGLCMRSGTTLSLSEYGALSGAFPNALSMSADLGSTNVSAKEMNRILFSPQTPAQISTLTLRYSGMTEESLAVHLVHQAARSLEYLDLGSACLAALYKALWPEKTPQEPGQNEHPHMFPKLTHLRFTLSDIFAADSGWNPRRCEFPRLERMYFAVELSYERLLRGSHAPLDLTARKRLAQRLLMYSLPCLKHLELDCVDEAVIMEAHRRLPNLEHLHLIEHIHLSFVPGSDAAEPSLSRILNSALSIESLREYRNLSSFRARYKPLELASPIHRLRKLNIASWAIGLCDLQVLLARLPELEDIHATLTDAHVYPHPESIVYNVTIKRMWLDSAFGEAATWVKGPVNSLLTFISHMMNLEELLLFSKAFLRLERAVY